MPACIRQMPEAQLAKVFYSYAYVATGIADYATEINIFRKAPQEIFAAGFYRGQGRLSKKFYLIILADDFVFVVIVH